MSNTVLFKDLGKNSRDLLSREFSGDKATQTTEWKGKTDGDVSVTAKMVRDAKAVTVGTLVFEAKLAEYNATFKNEVTTERKCKSEVKFTDVGTDGLNATVTVDAASDDVAGTFAVDFQNPTVGFDAKVKYASGIELASGLVLATNGFTLGGAVDAYNVSKGEYKSFTGQLGYTAADFEAGVTGKLAGGNTEVGVSYYHKLSGDWKVGADATYPQGSGDASAKLVFGTEWSPAKNTTYKARLDTEGTLALALKQQYSDNVTFSVGSSTDTSAQTSKFGFSLNLSS